MKLFAIMFLLNNDKKRVFYKRANKIVFLFELCSREMNSRVQRNHKTNNEF